MKPLFNIEIRGIKDTDPGLRARPGRPGQVGRGSSGGTNSSAQRWLQKQ